MQSTPMQYQHIQLPPKNVDIWGGWYHIYICINRIMESLIGMSQSAQVGTEPGSFPMATWCTWCMAPRVGPLGEPWGWLEGYLT